MKLFHTGRLGRRAHTSLFALITVAVLIAVLLFNALFSLLAAKGLWYLDLTAYPHYTNKRDSSGTLIKDNAGNPIRIVDYEIAMYTLTDGVIELLDNAFAEINATRAGRGEAPVHVDLIFCEDPDNLMSNSSRRMVYLTALCLQKQFPETVSVSTINVYKNPSAVQKYKTNSFATVYPSNVIIASGSEYRRLGLNNFFTFDSGDATEPWAYNGEKCFAAAILSVTKAESPICCLLGNHGEDGYSSSFLSLLDDAGYTVIENFDLEKDEIPADCRLIVSVAPKEDFKGYPEITAGTATSSEISKLSAYLDQENALMVFFDADTPTLPNLEEYLEKWGVSICRSADLSGDSENYLIRDEKGSLTEDGQTVISDYVTTGLGSSITADMRSLSYPSKVIFRNATALKLSRAYRKVFVEASEDTGVTVPYTYGSYNADSVYRQTFNIFQTGPTTEAYVGGEMVERPAGADPYPLMTITKETVTEPGDRNGYTTVDHNSYVIACSSTDFLCDELLRSNSYGNTDLVSSILRTIGGDNMAARIAQYLKPFHETDVDSTRVTVTSSQKSGWTTVLVLLPALFFFGTGIYVIVRRKYA